MVIFLESKKCEINILFCQATARLLSEEMFWNGAKLANLQVDFQIN
jgi:hypothetical protein